MPIDHIYHGQGYGDVADRLITANMDPGVLRPFVGKDGRDYVIINEDGNPKVRLINTPATLTKDAWISLDEAVMRAARPQLRVWGDIVSAGLTYNVPDGMGVTVLQRQTMTDAGEATFSMDGMREANRDRPHIDISNLPLPIVHGDFSFSAREIAVSRRGRVPLDTTMAEQTTRKVIEQVEKLTLGTLSSYTYGGGTIYGLTNHPNRLTSTITLPTGAGWRPATLVDEVLDMIQDLQDIYFNGPYGLYYSPGWGKYFDGDYSDAYNGDTLKSRLGKVTDIRFIRKVDYLSNYQLILFQLTPDVIRAVTGMRLTTLQWDGKGGLSKNFKVMAIMIPDIRINSDSNTGINHAVAA